MAQLPSTLDRHEVALAMATERAGNKRELGSRVDETASTAAANLSGCAMTCLPPTGSKAGKP